MKSSTEANSPKFPFLLLPIELQAATISWLEVTDLFTFSLTCKQVHVECNRQSVWRDLSYSCFHDIPEQATCISWRKYFYYRNIFLHPTKTLLQWRQLQSSTLPSPRQSLSGTYCRGKVIFIGGQTSVTTRFDDVYYFDPETFVFTKPKIHGELPPKFARHSAVEINGKIYVFGGFDGFGTFFGLAAFDLDTQSWSYPKTKGVPPVPRTNHAVAVVGTKMFLFGGNDTTRVGGEVLKYGTFGDFLELDIATLTWNQPKTKGKAPSPRSGHHMVAIGNKIWLFGGGLWNDKNKSWMERYSDMFVFDAETMEWTEVKQQNEPHSTFISLPHWVVNNFIFVYNDPLFCFDTITCKWYQLKTRGNNRPQKRFLTPATLVPNKNSVFLFGGVYTTVVNNLDQLVWPANIFHVLSKETGIDTNES